MSDRKTREGYRQMMSGGLNALSAEERQNLTKATAQSLRVSNTPLNLDEITYLESYIKIQEKFLDQQLNRADANQAIQTLNEEYSHLHPQMLRTDLMGDHLAGYEDDGWVPSMVCW